MVQQCGSLLVAAQFEQESGIAHQQFQMTTRVGQAQVQPLLEGLLGFLMATQTGQSRCTVGQAPAAPAVLRCCWHLRKGQIGEFQRIERQLLPLLMRQAWATAGAYVLRVGEVVESLGPRHRRCRTSQHQGFSEAFEGGPYSSVKPRTPPFWEMTPANCS